MSIVTRKGDDGTTGLMYNRRVPKTHPRVETYGTIDELNAALGVARATANAMVSNSAAFLASPAGASPNPSSQAAFLGPKLLEIQQQLVALMGEMATAGEDQTRYRSDGYPVIQGDHTRQLEAWVVDLESKSISYRGWATPGGTPLAGALDLARTICRRSERRVAGLIELKEPVNPEAIIYLNRLSDLLWLFARYAEGASEHA